ncbi:hypothetical protein Tco_0486564 [Tanacetum coccineum]
MANMEKLDGNIVQKYGSSKQVGFKQLGLGVETGVHGWLKDGWRTSNLKKRQTRTTSKKRNIRLCGRSRQSGLSKDLWAEDTTMSTYLMNKATIIMLYKNMGFNESGEYKKTFIGSGVARDKEQHSAHELLKYREDSNEAAFAVKAGLNDDMDARSDVYVLSNGCKKCSDNSDVYYWEYIPDLQGSERKYSEGVQVLQLEVGTNFFGGTLHTVVRSSLSRDCDVEKNDEQVFVDFDYTMGRSITVMAAYMTLTEAANEAIWLKGLAIESGFVLKIVACIATGALSKAIPGQRFQHRSKLLRIGYKSGRENGTFFFRPFIPPAAQGGAEEEQYHGICSRITEVILPQMIDHWFWTLEASGEFLVKSVHNLIDNMLLPKIDVPIRWVKLIPIKVNVFAWRAQLDIFPTRLNLSSRSLEIPLILVPYVTKPWNLLLISSSLARQVMSKVLRWWELEDFSFNSYDECFRWQYSFIYASKGDP